MPATAMERKLNEPFNPAEALPKASEFLAELRNEFSNLGLAAAAYNARCAAGRCSGNERTSASVVTCGIVIGRGTESAHVGNRQVLAIR